MAKNGNGDINLRYYEELRAVPQEAQKSFNNGRFSGTDINPMWRIKKLTEVFGPAGIGWYTEVVHRHSETAPDGTICTFMGINLYVKVDGEWSKPIYGEGGNTLAALNKYDKWNVSDEAYKMSYTDALSNASKALGLGADVWFGNDKNHSTKYDLQQERNADTSKPAATDIKKLVEEVAACKDINALNAIWNREAALKSNVEFKDAVIKKNHELKGAAA